MKDNSKESLVRVLIDHIYKAAVQGLAGIDDTEYLVGIGVMEDIKELEHIHAAFHEEESVCAEISKKISYIIEEYLDEPTELEDSLWVVKKKCRPNLVCSDCGKEIHDGDLVYSTLRMGKGETVRCQECGEAILQTYIDIVEKEEPGYQQEIKDFESKLREEYATIRRNLLS